MAFFYADCCFCFILEPLFSVVLLFLFVDADCCFCFGVDFVCLSCFSVLSLLASVGFFCFLMFVSAS